MSLRGTAPAWPAQLPWRVPASRGTSAGRIRRTKRGPRKGSFLREPAGAEAQPAARRREARLSTALRNASPSASARRASRRGVPATLPAAARRVAISSSVAGVAGALPRRTTSVARRSIRTLGWRWRKDRALASLAGGLWARRACEFRRKLAFRTSLREFPCRVANGVGQAGPALPALNPPPGSLPARAAGARAACAPRPPTGSAWPGRSRHAPPAPALPAGRGPPS